MKREAAADDLEVLLQTLEEPEALLEPLTAPDPEWQTLSAEAGKPVSEWPRDLADWSALTHGHDSTRGSADNSPSSTPDTVETTPSVTSGGNARQSTLMAKRRYREKRRNELHSLRNQSERLSARLAAIQTKNRVKASQLQRLGSAHAMTPGWRGIALRQLQRKLKAEALNQQLKTQVRVHHALVEHMRAIFQARLRAIDTERSVSLVTPCFKPVAKFDEADYRRIGAFRSEMDAVYAQADAVLSQFNLSLRPGQTYKSHHTRRWDPEAKSECIEFVESYVIPFERSDAVRSFPTALYSMLERECTPASMSLPDAESTMAIKFHFGCNDVQQEPAFSQSFVSKIFDEEHRTVIVWRAFTEQEATGAKFIETGWGVARGLSRDGGGTHETLTHFCTRMWPLHKSTVETDGYPEIFAQCGEGEALAFIQAVENAMMDRHVARNCVNASGEGVDFSF